MRKRILVLVVLAALSAAVASAPASSRQEPSVGQLPPRGLAVATATATIFLDLHGHELRRVPRSYGLYRTPHGQLLVSKGHTAYWLLRPATGELVPVPHVLRLWNTP